MTYHALVAEFKRRLIAHALAAAGGSVPAAAAQLGIGRQYVTRILRGGPGPRFPYRCPGCRHSWQKHCATGCAVPTCACRVPWTRHAKRAPAPAQKVAQNVRTSVTTPTPSTPFAQKYGRYEE